MLQPSEDSWPQGFRIHTGHAGLQVDDRDDAAILVSTVPAISAAVFTRSRFAGASAIMTTDTRLKLHTARVGEARIVGIAKGVGMIEPDMATMLAFVCTDA